MHTNSLVGLCDICFLWLLTLVPRLRGDAGAKQFAMSSTRSAYGIDGFTKDPAEADNLVSQWRCLHVIVRADYL